MQHVSAARQGRMTDKLVEEILKQIMMRDPDTGCSAEEQEYVEDCVRGKMFRGIALTPKDIAALSSDVLRRRQASRARVQLPDPAGAALRVADSLPALRASTPASTRPSSRASCVSTASKRSVALSHASRASSRAQANDMVTLQKLAEICNMGPYVPPPKHQTLKEKAETDPWLKRALAEKQTVVEEVHAARERRLVEQERWRAELAAQIDAKKRLVEAEKQEAVQHHVETVKQAQQSLKEDEERVRNERRMKEAERVEMALLQHDATSRRRDRVIAERESDKHRVTHDLTDDEKALIAEEETRRKAIARVKEMLTEDVEKKAQERNRQRLEQLEYEYALLREMNQTVEQERLKQEAARIARIRAARTTQDEWRKLAAEKAAKDAALKKTQDGSTIDGDRDFNDKERAVAEARRQKALETQHALRQQIREKNVMGALNRDGDMAYLNQALVEDAEAHQEAIDNAHMKRAAQTQWRTFLDMQRRAKAARVALDDVPVSISRPQSNTPWV
jgi:hypothetical protein